MEIFMADMNCPKIMTLAFLNIFLGQLKS